MNRKQCTIQDAKTEDANSDCEKAAGKLQAMSVHTDLDGFHWVVLVQFVDVVGDAGVEWCCGDRVDDSGFMCLLLVALAVRIDEQSDQASQDGAAEANGDHVEQVEVWRKRKDFYVILW